LISQWTQVAIIVPEKGEILTEPRLLVFLFIDETRLKRYTGSLRKEEKTMELTPEQFKKMLPLPVTLITTIDKKGVPNGAPYSSVMPVLRPLDLIAFASHPKRHTLDNIRETGQFVLNVMGRPSLEKAIRCAKPHLRGVNELEEEGLKTLPAKRVTPPRVQEAVGWIEGEQVNQLVQDTYVLIVGKVLCAEINDAYLEDGELETLPIVLNFPYFRNMGDPIARRDAFDV
jgi:flavin reductase (DIM6/NTAB) family NADH-FMN oxidoreductase RutF